MKDERFKNAGETVWVWDEHKLEAGERVLLAENKDGTCVCIVEGTENEKRFSTTLWPNYSFTDPNQKEYEPYGDGKMPQLDWVVEKVGGVRYLVTGYDPKSDLQLFFGDVWHSNKDIFNNYTDLNSNPIGKEKR